MTGEGMKEFFDAVDNARTEYEKYVTVCAFDIMI